MQSQREFDIQNLNFEFDTIIYFVHSFLSVKISQVVVYQLINKAPRENLPTKC